MDQILAGADLICSKHRCMRPAAATFRFDYQVSIVWLESIPTDRDDIGYKLCWDHAETFRAPIGWHIDDTGYRRPPGGPSAQPETPRDRVLEGDHPSVRLAGATSQRRRLVVRPADADRPRNSLTDLPDLSELGELEEHPSDPYDLGARSEPIEIAAEIGRLARDLARDVEPDSCGAAHLAIELDFDGRSDLDDIVDTALGDDPNEVEN